MKFATNVLTRGAPRVGTLTDFARLSDVTFETPLVLIHTAKGAVPHLTKDVFKMVTSSVQPLSLTLPTILSMTESIKAVGVPFGEFVGMKEYINLLAIQDPTCTTDISIQSSTSVSVWNKQGRKELKPKEYMDIVASFKPDMYVALCAGDVDTNSTKKHLLKSMERSERLLEKCLEIKNASETLNHIPILAAVEGGYDLEHRKRSINFLKDKLLDGYVIDGLHLNGPDVKNIQIEQINKVVKYIIDSLPPEKLRLSMGCWNPVTLLGLIELGIDVFDTSYPYTCAQNAQALTFMCDHQTCNNVSDAIIVSEKRYKEDFTPICSHCTCLTCRNHTRAYLHHLHHSKEMLENVLLMIHNTHCYLNFFETIRDSIKTETFPEFKTKICSRFPQAVP